MSVFDASPAPTLLTHPSEAPASTATSPLEPSEEPSMEADAHTARELSHALVVNRVGAAVDFDAVLRRLGLETGTDLQVYLDSTKRKRRSKMKKHK
jgi:hypothetical protein